MDPTSVKQLTFKVLGCLDIISLDYFARPGPESCCPVAKSHDHRYETGIHSTT
jgi:hypothetical protein